MPIEQTLILLPCHSLEDFPVHSEGEEADGLLAGWTALWHPALIHATGRTPEWCRLDSPPSEVRGRLLIIPPGGRVELPTGFVQRARGEGACVVKGKTDRAEILQAALEAVGPLESPPVLADHFLALGYAYLQVQILTRQMRYSSNLDELYFKRLVVEAAAASVAGDEAGAKEKLGNCFDLLAQERDIYYSVDAYLLDIVLVAPTTIDGALEQELGSPTPVNLLFGAGALAELERRPDLAQRVREAWEAGRIGVIAPDLGEAPLPLLSFETIWRRLVEGREEVRRVLGRHPEVYGRRRHGLTPHLPQLLHHAGYRGALHAGFEEGQLPDAPQAKVRWSDGSGASIDCLAKTPHNASGPELFLSLALKLGETMDMDHVATVSFARWPGRASQWLDDLRVVAQYTSVLGRPMTIEEYFGKTDTPAAHEPWQADRYQTPYLKQAVIRQQDDPLSRWVRYWRDRATLESSGRLHALAAFVRGVEHPHDSERRLVDIDLECDQELSAAPDAAPAVGAPVEALREGARRADSALPRGDGGEQGRLLWNPHSFVCRTTARFAGVAEPAVAPPVYAANSAGNEVEVVVDVPPLGFAFIGPASGRAAAARKRPEPALAEPGRLRNEFLEVTIHPETGGVRWIQSYESRGNRLSQQLALRTVDGSGGEAGYSKMVADQIEVVRSSPALGELRSRGTLRRGDEVVAEFQQHFRLWRGSRVLEVDIELTPRAPLRADPWNSYFCSRFAWKNEGAELWRDVHQVRTAVGELKRIEAPHYVEIDEGELSTTILTGGLPYHRRAGLGELDSLLIVRGERATQFRLGIGIDVRSPLQEALRLISPLAASDEPQRAPSGPPNAWMFHVDARHVVATHWGERIAGEQVTGFEARLLETAGRGANCRLRAFRPLSAARLLDLRGQVLSECRIEEGVAHFDIAAGEWLRVLATF